MIHFIIPAAHELQMREYLDFWGRDIAPRMKIAHTESLPTRTKFARGTYVLSGLDQYSSGTAALVASIHATLEPAGAIRFLNHPTRTLQRFALLNTLHRTGWNEFRAVRMTDDLSALRFPVFVRDASTHDGALSPLLHSSAELERAIGRVLVEGRSARNLMVVEFCDTSDSHGNYRKYSAFIVGRHIMPRYLSISREWMLKFRGGEFTPSIAEEERDYVVTNPHERALREVFALAGVEYGRIDYAMKNGRLQTWEINLNPTIGRGLREASGKVPSDVAAIRNEGKEHFYRRFREAWEDVDLAASGPDVEVALDPALIRAAVADLVTSERWLERLKRVLRPAKPILAPVVSMALPAIGRVAMRRTPSKA